MSNRDCWFEDSRISNKPVVISQHFQERFDLRCDDKFKNMPHFASLALRKGLSAENYTGWRKQYLESREEDNCKAVAYNDYCVIFAVESDCRITLITVYELPENFTRYPSHHHQKRSQRQARFIEENEYLYQPFSHDLP